MKIKFKIFNILELQFWALLWILSIGIFAYSSKINISIIYLGILTILHGLVYFNLHGGGYITPAGVFLLVSSLINGFGAVYSNLMINYVITVGHYYAISISYLMQIIVYHMFLEENSKIKSEVNISFSILNINKNIKLTIHFFLIVFIFTSTLFSNIHYIFSYFYESGIYISILIYAGLIIIYGKEFKSIIKHVLLICSLFILYYVFIFDNFGRINLVTLIISLTMIFLMKYKHIKLKIIITILFYPSIIIGSYLRSGNFTNVASGVGSIISPFYRFGQIIDLYLSDSISLRYGETIYSALVVFIPRFIWPNKPWNFNREITYIFAPQYVQFGHSEASTFYAEMFFNFGILSVIISIIFIGLYVKYLDNSFFQYISKKKYNLKDYIVFIIILMASAGLLNLMWGGISTFINRDGFRILLLGVFYKIFRVIFIKNQISR